MYARQRKNKNSTKSIKISIGKFTVLRNHRRRLSMVLTQEQVQGIIAENEYLKTSIKGLYDNLESLKGVSPLVYSHEFNMATMLASINSSISYLIYQKYQYELMMDRISFYTDKHNKNCYSFKKGRKKLKNNFISLKRVINKGCGTNV